MSRQRIAYAERGAIEGGPVVVPQCAVGIYQCAVGIYQCAVGNNQVAMFVKL